VTVSAFTFILSSTVFKKITQYLSYII